MLHEPIDTKVKRAKTSKPRFNAWKFSSEFYEMMIVGLFDLQKM